MVAQSPGQQDAPGAQKRWIWPFELLEKIGEGGMGVVYRARYVKNDRQVAVKLLPQEIGNPTILARFEREMEILKNLRHPHIVHTFGGVCEGDQRFYAMELVEGGTLDNVLEKRGRLSWEKAIEYGLQMCLALEYAHDQGIIHRDLKPGNFLLTRDGKLKLSDFGLATIIAGNKLTAAGKTLGTFRYMAPEQITGKPQLSARTDLYALGCVLFELITGQTPFDGDTPAEILHQHLQATPPRVTQFSLDCPVDLDRLIADLLEKDPEKRPADAEEVAERLRAVSLVTAADIRRPIDIPAVAKPSDFHPQERPAPAQGVPAWMLATCVAALVLLVSWSMSLWRDATQIGKFESALGQMYGETDPNLRRAAARAFGEVGPVAGGAATLLRDGLNDPDPGVRRETAKALGHLGATARGALPALIKLERTDPEPNVRSEAGAAARQIREAANDSYFGWMTGSVLLAALAAGGVYYLYSADRKP